MTDIRKINLTIKSKITVNDYELLGKLEESKRKHEPIKINGIMYEVLQANCYDRQEEYDDEYDDDYNTIFYWTVELMQIPQLKRLKLYYKTVL